MQNAVEHRSEVSIDPPVTIVCPDGRFSPRSMQSTAPPGTDLVTGIMIEKIIEEYFTTHRFKTSKLIQFSSYVRVLSLQISHQDPGVGL
jgi:hypothetical protein